MHYKQLGYMPQQMGYHPMAGYSGMGLEIKLPSLPDVLKIGEKILQDTLTSAGGQIIGQSEIDRQKKALAEAEAQRKLLEQAQSQATMIEQLQSQLTQAVTNPAQFMKQSPAQAALLYGGLAVGVLLLVNMMRK